jgi:hypothetical protein
MRHKLYNVWYNMIQRCHDEKHKNYKDYGGRGIKVCHIWKSNFNNFYNWAIKNNYQDGLQIDRINNDKNYEPFNCRWITHKENQQNKRPRKDLRLIEINNETLTIKEISSKYNIPLTTLNSRYLKGKRGSDLIKPVSVKNRPFK